jgi:hypothetical protein
MVSGLLCVHILLGLAQVVLRHHDVGNDNRFIDRIKILSSELVKSILQRELRFLCRLLGDQSCEDAFFKSVDLSLVGIVADELDLTDLVCVS